MSAEKFDMGNIDIAWCPGCGNFSILDVLKDALSELEIAPKDLVLVSGIGQAAKIPHYLKTNFFNGLHGRALSPATAIKASNPSLTVIAESGDGDMYGEGGNHFIHTIRRNPNITNIVHDNMVYGLTKGQASPTSRRGFKTGVQINGVVLEPFNPLAVAIGLDAGFVARTSITDKELTKDIIKQAVEHNGYALVDLLQPCPSFNKVNNYKWFKENTYRLEDSHDPSDRDKAFSLACKKDKLPMGVLYKSQEKPSFEENISAGPEPLYENRLDTDKLDSLIQSFA
ncbi:thiamine pyrophosphate-dependent enzyme [Sedimentisphaera salicampi]|uniref:2-oxoglutarate oxidoreductase subunit KorB n=1 Tax=Sedimentisphaera salicampi TaxID=1941349 RepID=A0A1W6LMJ4_9BACT|nr:thiamine pyrophosphate-dependent enzyme [Sedimentisphaera salicampi]ARN57018.1 2-oxoglutarate oxidoreductase subunit KorB [Sedimentisphaera salicampi]OXU14856.1 2-oxoglutarate oxidoreductase subunit KorB [Sedimentisphaera salicampi]